MSQLTSEAAVEQVLLGLQVGHQQSCDFCCKCGRELHGGQPVTAYASKTANATQWELSRTYCQRCDHTEVKTPTLGTTEVVVSGNLAFTQLAAQQTTRLVLTDITILNHSPPTDGNTP